MGVSANIRYYYLDEPAERGTYTQTQFYNVYAALARTLPSSQLCASSYDELQTFYWTPLHASNPNFEIICDEYHGNVLGEVTDYWNWFKPAYTYNSNMNLMNVVTNNGTGGGHNTWTGKNSSSWWQLFTEANNLGENTVWLYAYQTGNEAAVLNFCNAAFQSGWMYQYQLTLATLWQCNNQQSCTNCSWPNGNWTILEANMVWNGQWMEY